MYQKHKGEGKENAGKIKTKVKIQKNQLCSFDSDDASGSYLSVGKQLSANVWYYLLLRSGFCQRYFTE